MREGVISRIYSSAYLNLVSGQRYASTFSALSSSLLSCCALLRSPSFNDILVDCASFKDPQEKGLSICSKQLGMNCCDKAFQARRACFPTHLKFAHRVAPHTALALRAESKASKLNTTSLASKELVIVGSQRPEVQLRMCFWQAPVPRNRHKMCLYATLPTKFASSPAQLNPSPQD